MDIGLFPIVFSLVLAAAWSRVSRAWWPFGVIAVPVAYIVDDTFYWESPSWLFYTHMVFVCVPAVIAVLAAYRQDVAYDRDPYYDDTKSKWTIRIATAFALLMAFVFPWLLLEFVQAELTWQIAIGMLLLGSLVAAAVVVLVVRRPRVTYRPHVNPDA